MAHQIHPGAELRGFSRSAGPRYLRGRASGRPPKIRSFPNVTGELPCYRLATMYAQTVAPNGLDLLIRNALSIALEAGRTEVVSRLEAALSASTDGAHRYELDILAGEVRRDGAAIPLSRGERALIIAL